MGENGGKESWCNASVSFLSAVAHAVDVRMCGTIREEMKKKLHAFAGRKTCHNPKSALLCGHCQWEMAMLKKGATPRAQKLGRVETEVKYYAPERRISYQSSQARCIHEYICGHTDSHKFCKSMGLTSFMFLYHQINLFIGSK